MNEIKLPKPNFNSNITLMEALQKRSSDRTFAPRDIAEQDLSDLLWVAAGENRDGAGRTVPLFGDIALYVAMDTGVYLYNAKKHTLEQIVEQDIRSELSPQDLIAKAPLIFILTIDDSTFPTYMIDAMKDAHGMDFYYGNQTAYSTQNIYLYACSNNMNTVTIGQLNHDKIADILNLKDGHNSYLLQAVGYKK